MSQESIEKTETGRVEENPNLFLEEYEDEKSEGEKIQQEVSENDISENQIDDLLDSDIIDAEQSVSETVEVVNKDGELGPKIEVGLVVGVVSLIVVVLMILLLFKRKCKGIANMEDEEITISPEGVNRKTVKVMKTAKKCPVRIASVHDVGKRSSQQDSFGVSDVNNFDEFDKKGVLAIVADGMGGLADGDRMSQMVVVTMLKGFDEDNGDIPSSSLLLKLVHDANMEVCDGLGEKKLGKCGSTLTAVIVKNYKLSWISVGDSHIYVYRKGKLIKMNQDHNYAVELDRMVRNGEITMEEALCDPQRNALTSFIGMGELELVDQNEKPIALEKDDRILLMSDGVFGTVSETRIAEIMNAPLLVSSEKIESEIKAINKQNQDNYTCVVLEVK